MVILIRASVRKRGGPIRGSSHKQRKGIYHIIFDEHNTF